MAEPRSKPTKKVAAKKAPAKKVAPRTSGTPAKPAAPRKVAAPAKPKAPAKRAARTPPAEAPARIASPRTSAPAQWVPAEPAWVPVEPQWIPAPAPPPPAARTWSPPKVDPATGAWVPSVEPILVDPAAYYRGTRSIVMHVILGLTLAFFVLNVLAGIVIGIILLTAPDSEIANEVEDLSSGGSPEAIILSQLLTFLMVGAVPFAWVMGTRVVPWRGAVKYLQLRVRWKDWLLGVALVPLMIAAVWVLLVAYTCAVDGCGALNDEPEEGSNLDEMLDNLTWPVVIVVSLCAGIGEEILFRGVLQRWIGVWGQGLAFGLAHAVNAFPPQVIFAFGLGVVFGYLYKRGWSLVTLMVAHTLYDFTLLAMARMGLG